MQIKSLNDKKIALLGLGVENYAMLKFLLGKKVKAEFTVCDKRSKEELGEKYKELKKRVNWKLGAGFDKKLYQYDILFRAPGWPISCPGIREALKKKKTILYSPIRLFFDLCPTRNIIGVTGTKGKGTTSTLIYEIIRQAGKRAWLGGNIGIAPFAFLSKIKDNDWVVLELSSFQLEDLDTSPRVAVITNFYREHLQAADPNNPNFHQSLSRYWQAKLNIFKWQRVGGLAILNRRLAGKTGRRRGKGQILFFTKSALPSRLPGEHNKENIAAAETVARLLNIKPATIAKAVARFKGLEHRLELAREVKGVRFYNDSFATTPESAIIALKSFKEPIVLLAGGADKGSNFKQLAREIKKRVKFVVLFAGIATPRLQSELKKTGYSAGQMKVVNNIREAVRLAAKKAAGAGVVLMSPACASFGMFKNYKERGKLFKQEVLKLK